MLVAGLVATICGGFLYWWFSARHEVKRRTVALLDTVTIDAGGNRIARGFQAAGIDGILASRIILMVPSDEASGARSRDEVAAGFRFVADQADFTRFDLDRIESITIADDRATVVATLDAKVQVEGHAQVDGRYRTEFEWTRLDRRWLISRVAMSPL